MASRGSRHTVSSVAALGAGNFLEDHGQGKISGAQTAIAFGIAQGEKPHIRHDVEQVLWKLLCSLDLLYPRLEIVLGEVYGGRTYGLLKFIAYKFHEIPSF